MPQRVSRRRFIRALGGSAALSSLAAAPRGTRAARRGANEKVRLAWVGCGVRGNQLREAFHQKPEAMTLVGASDVHAGRLGQFKEKAGGKIATEPDYRKLLDRADVDAVIVATPGQWHCLPTLHACQAGKDVYIEKPLAWSIGEGQAMVAAARKYDRIVVTGTQQRSTPSFQEAVEFVQSGKLGAISHVRMWCFENVAPNGFGRPPNSAPPAELDWDRWLGPAPKRDFNPNYFGQHFWFWDYGGGWQSDWAVHHHDVTHWAMKVNGPLSVTGSGGIYARRDNLELPDTFEASFEYPGFLASFVFRHCNTHFLEDCWIGSAFYGENGTLVATRLFWKVIPESVQLHNPELRDTMRMAEAFTKPGSPGQGHPEHQQHFLDCVKAHRISDRADVEIGHRSSIPGHLSNLAFRLGRKLHWDNDKQEVTGDAEANAMLGRTYRAPWKLEV